MAKRNEHLVVIMLEPMPKGEKFEIWSRHITLVPWFPCNDEQKLDKLLVSIAKEHKKMVVNAGDVEEWGKKEKYTVQKIEDNDLLKQLHLDVFDVLEKNGFPIHQKDFLGDKYTPHIALRNRLQRGEPLTIGSKIKINCFTLVKQVRLKKSGRMIKELVKDYELK